MDPVPSIDPGQGAEPDPAARLVSQLSAALSDLPQVLSDLQAALAALTAGAPADPAEAVAAQAVLDVYLGWLRLVHHVDALAGADLDPRGQRLVAQAQALAPGTLATADMAAGALAAARSTSVPVT